MNISRLNLNLLLALDALLTEGSVTRAAEKTFITQSAMSNALHQLREIFQDELLIRDGKKMILTARAQQLAPQLHQVLMQIEQVLSEQNFNPATSERTFTIGMTEYTNFLLLPILYKIVRQQAPGVKLQVKHITLFSEAVLLEQNEIELGIGMLREPITVLFDKLFSDRIVCVAGVNHPLMQKKKLTLEDYLAANHLCFMVQSVSYPYITDTILANLGYSRNVVLRVPHIIPALYTSAANDLLVTVAEGIAIHAQSKIELAVREPPFAIPQVTFAQMWHPRSENDSGICWLRNVIKAVAKQLNLTLTC